MEIVKVKDGDYERYEQLLLQRDTLEKDAGSIMTAYIKVFGQLIYDSFARKIECIRLKKEIAWCQAAINRGDCIDSRDMMDTIHREMKEYEDRLHEMAEENNKALKSRQSDETTVLMVKKIYRKIAKLIHPDINPKTIEISELQELWNRTVSAYHMNNLKDMQELEVLVTKALHDLGNGKIQVIIPDIREKIAQLVQEIDHIETTAPYIYKDILASSEMKKIKKEEIRNESRAYEIYAEELKTILDHMLGEGSARIVWRDSNN